MQIYLNLESVGIQEKTSIVFSFLQKVAYNLINIMNIINIISIINIINLMNIISLMNIMNLMNMMNLSNIMNITNSTRKILCSNQIQGRITCLMSKMVTKDLSIDQVS